MPLSSGSKLGHFEILAPLGAGGMGEVYRARDTRLGREVAIKILPAHLALSPELRERFHREAETIARLKHPHICTLYDIGEAEVAPPRDVAPPSWRHSEEAGAAIAQKEPAGSRRYEARGETIHYLVMELLEGETLAERLRRGALPLDQALTIAIEISDALDKAHRKGAVHRDLKPANIMLVKEAGKTVSKLLDFGLAKLKQQTGAVDFTPLSQQPTLVTNDPAAAGVPNAAPSPTAQGMILGTVQYMSPEQVEGRVNEIDARSDIFSFGATLYEMLTGKKAFEGKSQASIMAKILEHDPPPVSALQPLTPSILDRVVKKCLAKDADKRWQSATDICDELQWIRESSGSVMATAKTSGISRRNSMRETLAWITAAVLLLFGAVVSIAYFRKSPPKLVPARFGISPPENVRLSVNATMMAISPDGRFVAFVASDNRSGSRLWVRALDSLSAEPLSGTEGATRPFWSSDSHTIAFYADGKLKKVDAAGGPVQSLADAPAGDVGSWNRDGVILLTLSASGPIYKMLASGGPAVPITELDKQTGETAHVFPHFLPDGEHFVFVAVHSGSEGTIRVASVTSSASKVLFNARSNIYYAPPGYLLFARANTLMAQPFDAKSLEITGDSFPVVEKIFTGTTYGRAAFSVSETGALIYRTGVGAAGQLTWFDRSGKTLRPVGESGNWQNIALSPDEKLVAVDRMDPVRGDRDIWILELGRNIFSRFTFGSSGEGNPVWAPDSKQIAFESTRGKPGIYRKKLSGTQEELLLESSNALWPEDWSSDGKLIVYGWPLPSTRFALLPVEGDRKPTPLLESPFAKDEPQLSPDGQWLAYTSAESGKYEVYVQPFQREGIKLQASTGGGGAPRWRRDGRELFYVAPDGTLMSVVVSLGANMELGTPKALFQARMDASPTIDQYAVSADGQRFLVNVSNEGLSAPITVVLNWTAALKK